MNAPAAPAAPPDPGVPSPTGHELQELREREPLFHREPPHSTRAHFESMTTPDFTEVGASGQAHDRAAVLDEVTARYAAPTGSAEAALAAVPADWEVSEFAVRRLARDVWLTTYRLTQGSRATRRSTVWLHSPRGWHAAHHQGTLTTE